MKKTGKLQAKTSKTDAAKFEQELDFLMRASGHAFPVTPEQVKAFGKSGISHPLPPELKDPDAVLKRISKKD